MRWALRGGPTTEASSGALRSTENPALTSLHHAAWSQSRMREPYLFYDEKISTDEPQAPTDQSVK